MNDEIKEILDDLLFTTTLPNVSVKLSEKKLNQLKDYITNLQERKITKEDVDKYFEENMCVSFDKFIENWNAQEEWANFYKKKYENLKEENERLKEMKDKIITKLKEEVSYLMPYEIYHDEVDSIVEKIEKIANGDDKDVKD